MDVLVLERSDPSIATGVATVAAVGFMLAAAFAHRWDYRLRGREVLIGGGLALMLALTTEVSDATQHAVGVVLGAVQIAAGVLFWPSGRRVTGVRVRGERLLAGLLTLWGVHRIATQFVSTEPGSPGYLMVHAVFITFYFLSTFAVIIMVLERPVRTTQRL